MSAFEVSNGTLQVLATAILQFGLEYTLPYQGRQDGDDLIQMFAIENQKSLNARYGDPIRMTHNLKFEGSTDDWLDPVATYIAASTYRYQSCEHETFEHSYSSSLTYDLQGLLVADNPHLSFDIANHSTRPGWEDANIWGAGFTYEQFVNWSKQSIPA